MRIVNDFDIDDQTMIDDGEYIISEEGDLPKRTLCYTVNQIIEQRIKNLNSIMPNLSKSFAGNTIYEPQYDDTCTINGQKYGVREAIFSLLFAASPEEKILPYKGRKSLLELINERYFNVHHADHDLSLWF